ncbi:MAG TPA: isoprenylcysteine carboxylmethyltransferase family protein [Terracidiphilus sp.]|nr:isoprenylcysteine carboxylmethyltransferase family protein [Terracidiphilus sp.]
MSSHGSPPKVRSMQGWEKVARRIRVPLGFATALLYLFELWRHTPRPTAILCSLLLVVPGVWLRGYAAGYVKKNRELTQTGPYAYVRNPLYLGSILIAAGFALALLSWIMALALTTMFLIIYIPVIASEERFLRATFNDFDDYCRRVPRLIPRLTPAPAPQPVQPDEKNHSEVSTGSFSLVLYYRHREYNAAIGAALLYLSLLLLHPVLAWFARTSH